MKRIGGIVRLQVQRASLKVGEDAARRYEPTPLVSVPRLRLDDGGVLGLSEDAQRVPDVHHRDHPTSKYRGENGVSVGFTAHYRRMRDRFGAHLIDGIAGENILVESTEAVDEVAAGSGMIVRAPDGTVRARLGQIRPAEPCAPFSRFALALPPEHGSDAELKSALQFLRHGTRGFYATLVEESATIALGDELYLA